MKRAQELRVNEFSVQKLRERHETIQRLTSQMQEMQTLMNSMNHSVKLSHVPSQPAGIPSSRSLLSCDKRLPLDTWNTSGSQEIAFGNNVLRLIHPEIIIKDVTIVRHQERQDQFHKRLGQGPLSQEMKSEIGAQFQCRHLQEGRRP